MFSHETDWAKVTRQLTLTKLTDLHNPDLKQGVMLCEARGLLISDFRKSRNKDRTQAGKENGVEPQNIALLEWGLPYGLERIDISNRYQQLGILQIAYASTLHINLEQLENMAKEEAPKHDGSNYEDWLPSGF